MIKRDLKGEGGISATISLILNFTVYFYIFWQDGRSFGFLILD